MRRAVVVGSGSIARRHIANLRRLWPEAEVACVSASGRTLDPADVGSTLVLPSLSHAAGWAPDLAIIASPATLHLAHAAPFAERDAAVLIEKPLAASSDEVERWGAVLAPHEARIGVAYNLRFLASGRSYKRFLEDGIIGRVTNVLAEVGQYLPDWRPQADYRSGVSAKRELGGGALLELSHEFDYLRWFFGDFDTVFCSAAPTGLLEIDVEDRADALMLGAGGLVANVHIDFLQRRATRRCKAIGERGNLIWDPIANAVTLEDGAGTRPLFSDPDADRNAMYLEQLVHFAAVGRGAALPAVGLRNARATLELIDRLRQSAATGRAMSGQRSIR